jgi:hypothetical protein
MQVQPRGGAWTKNQSRHAALGESAADCRKPEAGCGNGDLVVAAAAEWTAATDGIVAGRL